MFADRLVEVWVQSRKGHKGGQICTGWILGSRSVLTCKHALEAHEDGVIQVRSAGAKPSDDWSSCAVAAVHPERDAALLHIGDRDWKSPSSQSTRLAELGTQPFEATSSGFAASQVKPGGHRGVETMSGIVHPVGRLRDMDGLAPLSITTDTLGTDEAQWRGMSGAAVFDEYRRIVGFISEVAPGRSARRVLVVPSEELRQWLEATPKHADEFDLVVEAFDAPNWLTHITPDSMTESGTPRLVRDIVDLSSLGVHLSSELPRYAKRDHDEPFVRALEGAASGEAKLILALGESAAGKSRTAFEGLRRFPETTTRPLLVPQIGVDLSALWVLVRGTAPPVVWLDDLDRYLKQGLSLDSLDSLFLRNGAIVVATMRTSQRAYLQNDSSDKAWRYLTDTSKVETIDIASGLSDSETQSVAEAGGSQELMDRLEEGFGLGETLIGGPELMKRYRASSTLQKAFIDTVLAWNGTDVGVELPRALAVDLWSVFLPSSDRRRFESESETSQANRLDAAIEWALDPVVDRPLYEQSLVYSSEGPPSYRPHDYLVDRLDPVLEVSAAPDAIWDAAFDLAKPEVTALRVGHMLRLARAALRNGAPVHARKAFNAIVEYGTGVLQFSDESGIRGDTFGWFGDRTVAQVTGLVAWALLGKGVASNRIDGPASAIEVYDEIVERFGDREEHLVAEAVAKALYNKSRDVWALHGPEAVIPVCEDAFERFGHRTESEIAGPVAFSLVSKGAALRDTEGPEAAEAVFDEVIQTYGDRIEASIAEPVALAMYNKGVVAARVDGLEAAIQAYDAAIERFGARTESAIALNIAWAMYNKGVDVAHARGVNAAIPVFGDVAGRYGGRPEPNFAIPVAKALRNKGHLVARVDGPEAAVEILDGLVDRFGDRTEPAIVDAVASARERAAELR